MICGLCTISLVLGAAIAYLANVYPKHRAAIETLAGILLIGGLGMLDYALEAAFGHP
jgi:cytochrome c biogenesis protein CcdA